MNARVGRRRWRKIYANWRDSIILLRQFRWPLLFFCLALGAAFRFIGFIALSATGMAAPAFAAAGAGMDITRPLAIEGKLLSLARMMVENPSNLAGKQVGQLEMEFDISVFL